MKREKVKKSKISFKLMFITACIFVSLANILSQEAYTAIKQGDQMLQSRNPHQAIKKYRYAKAIWPFLQYDTSLTAKITTVESILSAPALRIFFKDTTNPDDVQMIINKIKKIQGVTKTVFVSKEEAFSQYKQKTQDPQLLSLVTKDIFLPSLEIFIDSKETINYILTLTKTFSEIESIIQNP